MSIPATKAELLNAIHTNYGRLRAELDRITAKQAGIPELQGHAKSTHMSVKNLVSYLIGWEELVLRWIDHHERGLEVCYPHENYGWNELGALAGQFYRDYDSLSYSTLLKRLDHATGLIVAEVEKRSQSQLYEEAWYKHYPLGRLIQLNSSSPFNNARLRLRRWQRSRRKD